MDDELHGQKNDTIPEPNSDGSYQVGYGKPPKVTRFKPGRSGNPKGRKKKAESVADQIDRILCKRITVTEGGVTKRLTLQEVMLTTLANKAAKGDLKALAFILDLAKSHEGQSGSMINRELLERDSKSIIDGFLRQQAVGLKISDVESDRSDPAAPAESAEEAAGFEAHAQIPDDISGPTIEGEDDVT
jgi:hypothetical protein